MELNRGSHRGRPGPVPDDHPPVGLRAIPCYLGTARTPRGAKRPRGGSRYPGTAAWYSVNWLACSEKAWPTIGPLTEPVRTQAAASTKLYGLVP